MVVTRLNRGKFSWRETRGSPNGVEPMKFVLRKDSSKSSGACLLERVSNRFLKDDEAGLFASLHRYRDGFFDSVSAVGTMRKFSIGFEDHRQSIFQILFDFDECFTLGIDARYLLDVTDVPFAFFHIDGGELTDHSNRTITYDPDCVKLLAMLRESPPNGGSAAICGGATDPKSGA